MAATRFKAWLLALALAGCDDQQGNAAPAAPAPAPEIPAAAVAGHCEERRFEETLFTVCRYDPAIQKLELIVDPGGTPLRSFERLEAHLGERAGRLLFAMNAGMYDEAGMPIGLHVENGRQRRAINLRDGTGNFHLKPNGVFAVDRQGRVSVTRSDRFRVRRPLWATQSGPMLVVDGALHSAFQPNGQSQLIRNGVGVSDPRTAWFVISEGPVSFGRFARFFRDALGCRNALYLDGNVSSLWDPEAGRQDGHPQLGPMVAVFRR